jgi:hypothetical protein
MKLKVIQEETLLNLGGRGGVGGGCLLKPPPSLSPSASLEQASGSPTASDEGDDRAIWLVWASCAGAQWHKASMAGWRIGAMMEGIRPARREICHPRPSLENDGRHDTTTSSGDRRSGLSARHEGACAGDHGAG